MFTSKALFSEIVCPYQQACILPKCIFKHPESKDSKDSVTVSGPNHVEHHHGQRKRQKVEVETSDSAHSRQLPSKDKVSTLEVSQIPCSKTSAIQPISQSKTTPVLSTASRPVSPPPLRRKLENSTPLPSPKTAPQNGNNSSALKSHISNVASSQVTPKVAVKTPSKTPPKKEALNPRVLKNVPTPASHDMRFRLLRALHDQFSRLNSELAKDANDSEEGLVLSDQDLITKALDLEEDAAAKPIIYSNVVKNKILVYKRMTVTQWKLERVKEVSEAKSLEAASVSVNQLPKPSESPLLVETGLSSEQELELLPRLYTPVTGLSKHGYVSTIPTDQEIESAKLGVEAAKGWEVCDRCKSRFQVFPGRREEDGALASGGFCVYHFGRPFWQERSADDPKAKREKKYRCCGQSIGDSPGCTQADSHVFKITEVKRLAAVMNFEKTPENVRKSSSGPVCIDGEMGYTVYGLELIRLTATSWPSGEELLDVLVRPIGQILDLNSRYSGIWPNSMAEAIPWDAPANGSEPPKLDETSAPMKRKLRIVDSPATARALLFSHLSPRTPLIGHGLENDMNAIRMIHPTIIDTALVFPHKAGLPYRNGLKSLMHIHLRRQIQVVVDGKMEGHDSKEDANAAGDLVRFALMMEWRKMKREGWELKDGIFCHPSPRDPPLVALPGQKGSLSVNFLERDPTVAPVKILSSAGKKRSRAESEKWEDGEVEG